MDDDSYLQDPACYMECVDEKCELYGVIVNNHEKRRILRWVYGVCLLVGICAHLRAFSRQDTQGCYDAREGH